jgi:hypothetical protein
MSYGWFPGICVAEFQRLWFNIAMDIEFDHSLKSWPHMFEAFVSGGRHHDIRRSSDRVFRIGEIVRLREFNPLEECFTGRVCFARISYITSDDVPCPFFDKAIAPGFCILSLERIC